MRTPALLALLALALTAPPAFAAGNTAETKVGALPLPAASLDAALVATLSPGSYTAQVSGVGNTSGVAILEVYDVSGSARLLNLSTRALVGSANQTFFSGLSVAAGGGARRVLIRAAGPALGALGVGGTLNDPAIAVLDSAGRWYDLIFDGPTDAAPEVAADVCDGCATVWYRGSPLGEACVDFSILRS